MKLPLVPWSRQLAVTSDALPTEPAMRPRRIGYWLWLAGPSAVLIMSLMLSTGDDRLVFFPGVGELPETCTMHSRLGIDCPGCGLTRCFIHLAHGNLTGAWRLSPVGILLFLFVVLQIPLSLGALVGNRLQGGGPSLLSRVSPWNEILLVGLLLALLLQWLMRLATGELF